MSKKEVEEWLSVASFDIDTVDLLIKEKGHASIIIFHIHQAIEKLLKAILIKNHYKIKKTHLLDELLSDIIDQFPQLNDIRDDVLEVNLYLPKLRYPYGENIEFNEALSLYQKFLRMQKILKTYI